MVDVWLIILCVIVPAVLTFVNLLFMSYFISPNPNDQENTFFPKIVVVRASVGHPCAAATHALRVM